MATFAEIVEGPAFMPSAAPVTRLRAGRKPDPYNPRSTVEDWASPDELELDGFIASSSSTEQADAARESVISTAVLTVANPEADVRRGDRVRGQDGREWLVVGIPSRDGSPFTGWRPTLEADLEEVLG